MLMKIKHSPMHCREMPNVMLSNHTQANSLKFCLSSSYNLRIRGLHAQKDHSSHLMQPPHFYIRISKPALVRYINQVDWDYTPTLLTEF